MSKFRKKPVVIEAIQWTGNLDDLPRIIMELSVTDARLMATDGKHLDIKTLEGVMTAGVGDWIIRGVKGEIYPCKPDIFEATYEAAEENTKSSLGEKA